MNEQIFGAAAVPFELRITIDEIVARDADSRTVAQRAIDDATCNRSARVQGARRQLEMLRATCWTGARELALKVAQRELDEAEEAAGRAANKAQTIKVAR
jgi:hypothetical protein